MPSARMPPQCRHLSFCCHGPLGWGGRLHHRLSALGLHLGREPLRTGAPRIGRWAICDAAARRRQHVEDERHDQAVPGECHDLVENHCRRRLRTACPNMHPIPRRIPNSFGRLGRAHQRCRSALFVFSIARELLVDPLEKLPKSPHLERHALKFRQLFRRSGARCCCPFGKGRRAKGIHRLVESAVCIDLGPDAQRGM